MSERKSQQELDFERKHEEDLQRLRGLRLIDDDFMAAVFEERACAEFLLQIILKRDDLTVKEVHGQYSIKNLQGRSVRLDILAVDRENRAYNIEVQRSDRGASEKRARYNSSLLDANLTDAGDDYDALNETYVIFITENDVLKAGLPIYHVDRTIRETGTFFNDQAHIVYEYLQSVEAQRALRMTIVAEVAQAYYELVALDTELEIVRQTQKAREEGVRLARIRFEGGLTSETSYQQAQVELARTATLVPDLERRISLKENDISFLVGEFPTRIKRVNFLQELDVPESLPVGLPSDLLERRPDVRVAEQQLRAEHARVKVNTLSRGFYNRPSGGSGSGT